jgi:aminocarboxymuconate-semialdehyde decarboxylase
MHPDRLVAFATVALQHPDLAAQQLETGMKKYGLRGAGLGGSVEGLELSDPKFHPFWAKAEALGALVFIHPQWTAELERTGRRLICIKTEPYPSSLRCPTNCGLR